MVVLYSVSKTTALLLRAAVSGRNTPWSKRNTEGSGFRVYARQGWSYTETPWIFRSFSSTELCDHGPQLSFSGHALERKGEELPFRCSEPPLFGGHFLSGSR